MVQVCSNTYEILAVCDFVSILNVHETNRQNNKTSFENVLINLSAEVDRQNFQIYEKYLLGPVRTIGTSKVKYVISRIYDDCTDINIRHWCNDKAQTTIVNSINDHSNSSSLRRGK